MKISVVNSRNGVVLVTCSDWITALMNGKILGVRWRLPHSMAKAYAYLDDQPDLVGKLEDDGYIVDSSEYTPMEQEETQK